VLIQSSDAGRLVGDNIKGEKEFERDIWVGAPQYETTVFAKF